MPVFKSDLHVLAAIVGVLLLAVLWQVWMASSLQSRFDHMRADLQTESKTLQGEVATLTETIGALRQQIATLEEKAGVPVSVAEPRPAPEPTPDTIMPRLTALGSQTAAVGQALETAVAALKAETGAIKSAQGEVLAAVSELKTEVGAAKAAQGEALAAVSALKAEAGDAKAALESLQATTRSLTTLAEEQAKQPQGSASKAKTFQIFFDKRGSIGGKKLQEQAGTTMTAIKTFMGQRKDCTITAEGHTDTVGPDWINLDLSRRRAQAVTELLRTQMPEASIEEPRWAGERRLQVRTPDRTSERRNRRVDISVRCGAAQARS